MPNAWLIVESVEILKRLKKRSIPREIIAKYEAWKNLVATQGPHALLGLPGFRDHALAGEWKGYRASYLSRDWRVIYRTRKDEVFVEVERVSKHDYRRDAAHMEASQMSSQQEKTKKVEFVEARQHVRLTVAESLKLMRGFAELSQAELAEKSGVSQTTISALEKGRILLGVRRAERLARAMKVHPAVLLYPNWRADSEEMEGAELLRAIV
jgi:addiction module RelE/StbE family toxin